MRTKAPPRWALAVPNTLSGARLVLAVLFPVIPEGLRLAAVLIAGLTDLFDGVLARRLGASSWRGGLLDAVADKAFTLSALVTFALSGSLAWWHIPLLLLRDLAVGGFVLYGAAVRAWTAFTRVPSRWPGKLTTAAMFATLIVLAARPDRAGPLVWITAALGAVAAIDYGVVFARGLSERRTLRRSTEPPPSPGRR